MRWPHVHHARRWIVATAASVLVLGGGGASAFAASTSAPHAHPRLVRPPAAVPQAANANAANDNAANANAANPANPEANTNANAAAAPASQPAEFSTTANPVTLDPPVKVPPTRPAVVTIADNASFGNAPPPATSTVALPKGDWAKVVLDVTGTEKGTQYDRLLNVYDGATQIFMGVTPEPTAAGITWHVQKDVTGYLPIMKGTQTFSTTIDNYTNSTDTGIPVITARLLFYPGGGGYAPAHVASPADPSLAGDATDETGPASPANAAGVPNDIVPIVPSGDSNDFNEINTGQTLSASVTLPDDITTATLDLYAVGQINDEFWWGLNPAFREIEVSIDGKPAGVVWPYPYVYTGGVNPLIWRPLTAIHTEDIPSYRIDLTPFAGLLSGSGPHTIGLSVVNNNGYWLAGGDLMLTTGGPAVTGSVTQDTLSFPGSSSVTSATALAGSTDTPVTSESASRSYAISGTVRQGGRAYADTLNQSLQFGNDQTNVDPAGCTTSTCYSWVHQETTSSASEAITGPGVRVDRTDKSSYTIDAPNGWQQNASASDFFVPASVTQQLTDVAAQGPYQSTLSESIVGYGALEEDGSATTISNGETTGTITQVNGKNSYIRTITTRGGVVVSDIAG
jgi:hypothetical protein